MKTHTIQLNKLFLMAVIILSIFSCKKNDDLTPPPPPPNVCEKGITISYNRSNTEFNRVDFSSNTTSSDFVTYSWTFGDGQTSSDPNPTNNYPAAETTYTVHFSATTSCGETVTIDTTVAICPSCFTYKIKCDTLIYAILQNGSYLDQIRKGGEFGTTSSDDYLHTSVNPNSCLSIKEGINTSPLTRAFTLNFGHPGNFTSYGFPATTISIYPYTVATFDVNAHLEANYNGTNYNGYASFNQVNSSGSVMVTRSDSVLTASFFTNLVNSSGVSKACNGFVQVSRYRYYYE